MTPLAAFLIVAALVFAIGLAISLTRRNAILVLIGIELMLNAANLNLIAFWRFGPHANGSWGRPDRHDVCDIFDCSRRG